MTASNSPPRVHRHLLGWAVSTAFVAAALSVLAATSDISTVLQGVASFLDGVVGSPTALGATAALATPIMLCGLAAHLSFRAGIFNLGQPGQFVIGGLAAGVVGPHIPGPNPVVILSGLIIGAAAGLAWAALIAAVKSDFDILIVALLLNYIADGVSTLVSGRLARDPNASGLFATEQLDAVLPRLIDRTNMHLGVILALGVVAVFILGLGRSVAGHRLTLFGLNPRFAAWSGTRPHRYRIKVILLGGAVCGLAGAIQVFGVFGRYVDGSLGGASSPAWNGVVVALLVGSVELVLIPAAILIASLSTGLAGVERDLGMSSRAGLIVQALILAGVALARRQPSSRRNKPGHQEQTEETAARLEPSRSRIE